MRSLILLALASVSTSALALTSSGEMLIDAKGVALNSRTLGDTYNRVLEGDGLHTALSASPRGVSLNASMQTDGDHSASTLYSMQDAFTVSAEGEAGEGLLYARIRVGGRAEGSISWFGDPDDADKTARARAGAGFAMTVLGGTMDEGWQRRSDFGWSVGIETDSQGLKLADSQCLSRLFNEAGYEETALNPLRGTYLVPIRFRFDDLNHVTMGAFASSYMEKGSGVVGASLDARYAWSGIDSVYALGAGGSMRRLSAFSALGVNGRDFAAPVPEPASILALGAGVAALRRRRRARS